MNHPDLALAFVADKPRAKWHDETLWFVRSKRDKAAWQLPEWELLRETAAAIKAHTMSHLGDYLDMERPHGRPNRLDLAKATCRRCSRPISACR